MIIRTNRTVRIRIVSGGMEHRTLDSLRSHFSITDLKDPLKDGRLISWLETIGEKEMAEKVENIEDKELSTIESRRTFCELFGAEFTADMFCEDFDMLCEAEEKRNDLLDSSEKWIELFRKCRKHNEGNADLCDEIDIRIAEIMMIEEDNLVDAIKILAPIADRNKEARDLLWYFEISKDYEDFAEIIKVLSQFANNGCKSAKERLTEIRPSELVFEVNGVSFKMILVEGNDTLSDYYMGETVVTCSLWRAVMNFGDPNNFPRVLNNTKSWDNFLEKLKNLTGFRFNYPTEEQWLLAAKGGNKSCGYKYSGSDRLSEVGWCRGKLHPVAELEPNELGFYDMSGNVKEICITKFSNPKYAFTTRGSHNNSWAENCVLGDDREDIGSWGDHGLRLCLNI